jgi:hypothetical protein
MGELAATTSPPPPAAAAVVPVVFVDGEQSVDLGTVTVLGGVKRLQAVVADRVGVAPHQISASLARPRRARRVPLDDATDLAAAVAREGNGCYVVAGLRRSRRERRGGRSRRDRKGGANGGAPGAGAVEKTILKRLPPTDLASLVGPPPPLSLPAAPTPPLLVDGGWGYDDYEARLRELQRQRDWYLMSTAAAAAGPDPSYFHLAAAAAEHEDPAALWSPRLRPSPCPECEAAAAAGMRQPAFHWCVRDAVVSVGFRSHVGPIERPPKKTPSPPPTLPPPSPGRLPGLLGMPVY